MTQAQLQKMIQSGENISVEFKKCTTELNNSAFETVCSFLNRTGGHLILGVDDDGNVVGVNANSIIFSDRVITENWTKPSGQNPVTLETLETHPKNPMIARVFKELGWVEELGSGRKNIMKYVPYYFNDYSIEINNEEKFIFTLSYRDNDINLKSEQIKLESEQINSESEQIKLESEQITPVLTATQIDSIYALINENVNGNKRPLNDEINNENDKINNENDKINNENDKINDENDKIKESLFIIIKFLYYTPNQNRIDLTKITQKGQASTDRYIKILKDANIIEFRGSRKTGGYYLTQRAKERLQNEPLIM